MFVVGGKGPDNSFPNDIYALDVTNWTWSEVTPIGDIPPARYRAHPCKPRFIVTFYRRFNHASALVGDKIVIHGGWGLCKDILDDLWVFDSNTFDWIQPNITGLLPLPRYLSSFDPVGSNQLKVWTFSDPYTKWSPISLRRSAHIKGGPFH